MYHRFQEPDGNENHIPDYKTHHKQFKYHSDNVGYKFKNCGLSLNEDNDQSNIVTTDKLDNLNKISHSDSKLVSSSENDNSLDLVINFELCKKQSRNNDFTHTYFTENDLYKRKLFFERRNKTTTNSKQKLNINGHDLENVNNEQVNCSVNKTKNETKFYSSDIENKLKQLFKSTNTDISALRQEDLLNGLDKFCKAKGSDKKVKICHEEHNFNSPCCSKYYYFDPLKIEKCCKHDQTKVSFFKLDKNRSYSSCSSSCSNCTFVTKSKNVQNVAQKGTRKNQNYLLKNFVPHTNNIIFQSNEDKRFHNSCTKPNSEQNSLFINKCGMQTSLNFHENLQKFNYTHMNMRSNIESDECNNIINDPKFKNYNLYKNNYGIVDNCNSRTIPENKHLILDEESTSSRNTTKTDRTFCKNLFSSSFCNINNSKKTIYDQDIYSTKKYKEDNFQKVYNITVTNGGVLDTNDIYITTSKSYASGKRKVVPGPYLKDSIDKFSNFGNNNLNSDETTTPIIKTPFILNSVTESNVYCNSKSSCNDVDPIVKVECKAKDQLYVKKKLSFERNNSQAKFNYNFNEDLIKTVIEQDTLSNSEDNDKIMLKVSIPNIYLVKKTSAGNIKADFSYLKGNTSKTKLENTLINNHKVSLKKFTINDDIKKIKHKRTMNNLRSYVSKNSAKRIISLEVILPAKSKRNKLNVSKQSLNYIAPKPTKLLCCKSETNQSRIKLVCNDNVGKTFYNKDKVNKLIDGDLKPSKSCILLNSKDVEKLGAQLVKCKQFKEEVEKFVDKYLKERLLTSCIKNNKYDVVVFPKDGSLPFKLNSESGISSKYKLVSSCLKRDHRKRRKLYSYTIRKKFCSCKSLKRKKSCKHHSLVKSKVSNKKLNSHKFPNESKKLKRKKHRMRRIQSLPALNGKGFDGSNSSITDVLLNKSKVRFKMTTFDKRYHKSFNKHTSTEIKIKEECNQWRCKLKDESSKTKNSAIFIELDKFKKLLTKVERKQESIFHILNNDPCGMMFHMSDSE